MTSANPFRAFVSYSHADAAFAARLQRQLESYRLPKRLADRAAPWPGLAQGRIGPVFRDRADLSASQDLSAAVREAIALSSALIVVASQDAARSVWVRREIELFQELHPGAPILVALIKGEPEESFPEALRSGDVEPLAADFRREGDGDRLAFLKIVAALLDVPLDALVQRDAQRHLRRVTAVTAGSVIMTVIMALLLVMALRAQEEAERQRAGAEGLVEYMLTDLRESLRGVGRPDVMAPVNKRAMDYYSAQGDLTELPDSSLERRARAIHAIGEDEDASGHRSIALARFREAHRTTAAILARHPKDPDAIFAHAQSEYWVGYAAWTEHNRSAATPRWLAYLRQAEALAEVEPRSVRSQVELGFAHGNLCDLDYYDAHDLESASRHCQAAIRFMQAALAKAPTDRKIMQDLANRYGWMARVQLARKEHAAGIASRKAEIALIDRLRVLDPGNLELIKRRAWPDIGLAQIWIDMGHPRDAVTLLEARWHSVRPHMAAGSSDQLWDTGLRLLFFLSRAKKSANFDNKTTETQIDILISRYLRLFPNRATDIRNLRKEIEG